MIYRGAQVGPEVTYDQLRQLHSFGCNIVRFQIAPYPEENIDFWRGQLHRGGLNLRNLCTDFPPGMVFAADLHRAPKLATVNDIITAWRLIDFYLADRPNVIGYGILNEPPYSRERTTQLMKMVGHDIRTYRPKVKLSLTFPYSDPPHFVSAQPYRFANSWYEIHMYLPLRFTHQGVYPQFPVGQKYPTARLHKERLKQLLRPVRDFQLMSGGRRKIWLSEFGCSSLTDPASRLAYLTDVIEIAEEYNWSWSYHATFESSVWAPDEAIWNLLKEHWSNNA